jgi:hypothetical protein
LEYVTEKFPFNHTLNMESTWGRMKYSAPGFNNVSNEETIQLYCDAYAMQQCVKPSFLY